MHTPPSTVNRLPFEELGGRIRDREYEPKIRTTPVTVCIAAMCQWDNKPMIVGATDRMLTAGDMQFEPFQTKVATITERIVTLVAGDISTQVSIILDLIDEFQNETDPEVKTVAESYSKCFSNYRRQQAELKYLSPLNLDFQSFIQNQHIPQNTIDTIVSKLENSRMKAEAIIAGIDNTGVHIYTVRDPGKIALQDAVGFAAIGVGEWHAQSFFMFKGYNRNYLLPQALFITYAAKRRAEVAPDVGRETDMFIIDPFFEPKTQYVPISVEIMAKLETTYETNFSQQKESFDNSTVEIDAYIKDIINQPSQQTEEPYIAAVKDENQTN